MTSSSFAWIRRVFSASGSAGVLEDDLVFEAVPRSASGLTTAMMVTDKITIPNKTTIAITMPLLSPPMDAATTPRIASTVKTISANRPRGLVEAAAMIDAHEVFLEVALDVVIE